MENRLADMKRSISRHHAEDRTCQLYTEWGEKLTQMSRDEKESGVLTEYPRPYLQRESYRSLNGYWDFCLVEGTTLPEADTESHDWQGKILVPFSPESVLSEAGRQLLPTQTLWYHKALPEDFLKEGPADGRLLLHFGAVDFACCVYVNGVKIPCLERGKWYGNTISPVPDAKAAIGAFTREKNPGENRKSGLTHSGGYTPFTVDITDYLNLACAADNSIPAADSHVPAAGNHISLAVLDVTDTSYHNRGKQTLKRGGMFYTAQSGIWQSVWLEWVPALYIRSLCAEPDFDRQQVKISITLNDICVTKNAKIQLFCEGKTTVYTWPRGKSSAVLIYHVDNMRPWTPEEPYLYEYSLRLEVPERKEERESASEPDGKADGTYRGRAHAPGGICIRDEVRSVFGMRCFTIEKDPKGIPRFYLNHHPYFLNGVLDQGYWPDGLYTAPSDEALLHDIRTMKRCGYNLLRKHVKVECQRWYYHCDREGMIVWQDMVSGGEPMNMLLVCYLPTGLPQIGTMVPDSLHGLFHRKNKNGRREWYRETAETIEALKPATSLAVWVAFNEGWGQFDSKKATTFIRGKDSSRLIVSASGWFDRGAGDFLSEHNYFHALEPRRDKRGRAWVLSEYGGFAHHVDGHSFTDRIYGYRKYDTLEDYRTAVTGLQREIDALMLQGLSTAVYTQVSDVEEEVNGIMTYDRKICKL
ncbi:MAG: glycoside hydrolase family 2 [Lachnospiraceae bacterium]|nr:glycoside hydrolase family 2 [Lachnospiraceae bacterium]